MKVHTTDIDGLVVIEPNYIFDDRGFFCEQYSEKDYCDAGITARFVQDNESMSSRGVVRGLHWQDGSHCQAKLVRVEHGCVWDVAVDIRKGSPTFGKYHAVYLCSHDSSTAKSGAPGVIPGLQFFIPRGFAHGFLVIEDSTRFSYKCDNYYCKDSERGLLYSDPYVGIRWPDIGCEFRVSGKDMLHPTIGLIDPYDWGLI